MFSTSRSGALRHLLWSTPPNEVEYIEAWKFSPVLSLLYYASICKASANESLGLLRISGERPIWSVG